MLSRRFLWPVWILLAVVIPHASAGDFDELNDLLQDVLIRLPDATVGNSVVTVTLSNVRCTNIAINDIVLNSQAWGIDRTSVQLDLEGLDFICFLDYEYSFIFSRSGTATIESIGNRASLSADIFTDDNIFSGSTSSVVVTSCAPEVQITDVNIEGSISALVFDSVVDLLRGRIEDGAEEYLCVELRRLATTTVSQWLRSFDEKIKQYPPEVVDLLASEKALVVPETVTLLDLDGDKTSASGELLDYVLQEGVSFITKTVDNDLNVNVLLRKQLLDAERAYQVDFDEAIVLYEGHDRLMQSSVALNGMEIYGLDTITRLEPYAINGNHTLQTELSLSYLRVELDISIKIKPSTKSDSLVVNPSSQTVVNEKVTINFGLENVIAVASFLLAVDEGKLGSLQLGSILETSRIPPCFLSTIFKAEIGGLAVEVGDISPPTLEGFVSPGIDRVVSSAVNAAFLMYEDTLLRASPGLFHMEARDFINQKIADEYFPGLDRECPWMNISTSDSGFIDFRDLFLPADEALAAGGSGALPYGDVVPRIISELKENVLAVDDDGSPKINGLIRDLMSEDTDATLLLGDLLSTNSSLNVAGLKADFAVKLLEARVENLDSFGYPLQLLDPVSGEANLLNTTVSIGEGPRDLRFSARLVLSISDGAGLDLQNEVEISLDLSSASLELLLLVEILELPFFSVPLRDMLNLNCWLATIFPSAEDATGIAVIYQAVEIDSLFVNVSCVSCSSPDFDALVYQLYSPDGTGNATKSFLNLAGLVLESDYLTNLNEGLVASAAKQCPHSPEYDEGASYADLFKSGGAGSVFVAPNRDSKAHFFNMACALVAVFLVFGYYYVRRRTSQKYQAWKSSLPCDALYQLKLIEDNEREEQADLDRITYSMFRSPQLLPRVRWGFPVAMIFTIALQLCGHLAVLSTVNLEGQIAGEPFTVERFLQLSFFTALKRSASNGGREMAVLTFIFTGLYPYFKLCASLVIWFLPPEKLSVSRRGTIFLWLDVFAKLSVVDVCMMLIAVGALMVYSGGLDESLKTEEQFFALKVLVQPGLGFYTIIMAQRVLRVSSRFLLDCQQTIIDSAIADGKETSARASVATTASGSWELDDEESGVERSSQSENAENEDTAARESEPAPSQEIEEGENQQQEIENEQQERQLPRRISLVAVFAGASALLIGLIGAILAPAISLDTKTLWSMIDSERTFQEAVNEFSVFRVVTEILLNSRTVLDSVKDYIGLGFLLILVVIVALTFPVMKGIASLRAWNRQRTVRAEERVLLPNGGRDSFSARFVRSSSLKLKRINSSFRQWYSSRSIRKESDSSNGSRISLLPLYRLKAWRQMDVYVFAFVIACWQLAAVTVYTLHLYCYFLEMLYRSFEYLGLVETTSAQCFGAQLSDSGTVAIVCIVFSVLFATFLIQAFKHYRKVMAGAYRSLDDGAGRT